MKKKNKEPSKKKSKFIKLDTPGGGEATLNPISSSEGPEKTSNRKAK